MDDRNRRRRVTYRPSRVGGVVSLIFGLVFVAVGIFVVIPQAGWFGIVWTVLAAVITAANVYAAFGGKYGGRDIRRVIRSDIEDKIAELIIDHAEQPLSEISIGSQDGEITVDGK